MTAPLPPASPDAAPTPSLPRRMAAFVYEGVLLFGVVMIAGYVFAGLMQQRHALADRHLLQAVMFAVLGLYFVWFWTHGGQTVAMKAWHVRLVDAAGRPVGVWRASARYVLSWLWFMPALLSIYLSGLRGTGAVFGLLVAGVVGYALLALLNPRRQFVHDVLCNTRLVTSRPPPRRPRPSSSPTAT